MIRAHRIALDLNNRQRTYCAKSAGVARFAYNWALAEWNRQYEAHKNDATQPKPSEAALRRQLNARKAGEFPWMLEVSKCAPQQAIMQLGAAFKNFFEGRAERPSFHKKGVHDSFTLDNEQFDTEGKRLRLPHIGWVRMREQLRFTGKILSATISREADRWYISVTVELPAVPIPVRLPENQGAVGVDVGVEALATLSTGERIVGPKPHRALMGLLRRLGQALSRKAKGSRNREKAKIKLGRLHARIAHIRKDSLHKLSSGLVQRYAVIGIEDLNVRGMTANRRLARSILDMGWHELHRQLDYKAESAGARIVRAPRFYPSSKLCDCGHVLKSLPLSQRVWTCPQCSAVHQRDPHAAHNLETYAVLQCAASAASSAVAACGAPSGGGTGLARKRKARPTSRGAVNQEVGCLAAH